MKDEDKYCRYEATTGSCAVCKLDEGTHIYDCERTTQPSASDCFAACAPDDTSDEPFCSFYESTNKCFAYPGGEGGSIGATTLDQQSCLDHCASVGVPVD